MINVKDLITNMYKLEVGQQINLSASSVAETMKDVQICYKIRENLANINSKISNSINISRWYDKGMSGITITRVADSETIIASNIPTKVRHDSIDKWIKYEKGPDQPCEIYKCPHCDAEQKGDWAIWCWLCGNPRI